jgi:plastocyanin
VRRLIPIGAFVALTLTLGACSSSPSASPAASPGGEAPSAAPASGGGSGQAVTIKGFAFGPTSISVAVGTTVTWTNEDGAPHTVTFDSGGVASDTLATGATYSRTFDAAGTFAYHCAIHPSMTGSVTVTG